MHLGISSYTYGWAISPGSQSFLKSMDEIDLINKAIDLHVSLVQFGDNLPLHLLSEEKLDALKRKVSSAGIKLEVGARGLTSSHLEKYIKLSSELNSNLLRFVIDEKKYEPSISSVIAILKDAIPLLEQNDMIVALENHDRLRAREFVEIVEKVASDRIGICLDSVNSMGAGEGLEQIVDLLAPHTTNLHIKDFGIKRLPHLMGFQIDGRPAGTGMLNIPWLLEKITPYNKCKTAILEQWVVPEKDISATIRKEVEWAEAGLKYLRPFFRDNR